MSKLPRISGQEHSNLINILKQASDGLLFMSESEYPFEVFLWDAPEQKDITPEFILQKIGIPLDTPVEVVELDSFFEVAIAEQDDEKKELDHFLTLEHIMRLAKARAYTYIKTE